MENSLPHPRTAVVALSGGVDSSVSALLLKQQGWRVIGLFMKNWEEGEECPAVRDHEDVVRICDQLDIPFYTVNFTQEYHEQVFSHFLEELRAGHTPNPDILCNREIKFKALLDKALSLGADVLATGHYARIDQRRLLKGNDPQKDQSYFLYTLSTSVLGKIAFPVGHLSKPEVRAIAHQHNLATADKKDSTGICFIGERHFRTFLQDYLPYQPGPFETPDGKVVGTHIGTAYYTIGQRKGIGIGGAGAPWFVVGKNMERNAVIIAQGEEHPALYGSELIATEPTWVSGTPPAPIPFSCRAKIRYRQADQQCTIVECSENQLLVHFAKPQRAITPRQSIVFYDGDVCLGGAWIAPRAH